MSTKVSCVNCGKEVMVTPSRLKKVVGICCSRKCAFERKEFREKMQVVSRKNPGSFKKGSEPWNKGLEWHQLRREKHPRWSGGEIANKDGYIITLKPEHPHADGKGYILRSHVVMEAKIGRLLERGEVVHHINRNRTDDRPENLELFGSQSDHALHHHNEGHY